MSETTTASLLCPHCYGTGDEYPNSPRGSLSCQLCGGSGEASTIDEQATAVLTPTDADSCPWCRGTGCDQDADGFSLELPCRRCGRASWAELAIELADGAPLSIPVLTPMDGVLADLQYAIGFALTDAKYAMQQLRRDDTIRAMDAVERIIAVLGAYSTETKGRTS